MRVLLFCALACCVAAVQPVSVDLWVGGVVAAAVLVLAGVVPEGEDRVVFLEEVPGHDAVHGGILHVDVQVRAVHCYHYIEIQL